MDTVVLVQQQQQALDGDHQGKREQDHVNDTVVSAESHAVDRFSGETEHSARETAVVTPGNGGIGDSSTQCSDVDDDDDDEEEETDVEEGGWITNLPVSSTISQRQPAFATNGDIAVLPNTDQPIFDNVRVQNSKNVRLVNKTCYNCPVTQIVYTNSTPNQDASKHDASSACDNTSHLSTSKDNEAPNGCIFPQNTKLNKVTQWLWTWKRAVLSCVLTLILLAIVVPITVHFTHQSDVSPAPPEPTTSFTPTTPPATLTPTTPTTPTTSDIPTSSIPGNNGTEFRIVERDEWGARPPSRSLRNMKLPVSRVIICHTALNFCTNNVECANELRIIQNKQMNFEDFADIAYNFMVGGDGLAYVGRNWSYTGGHSEKYNGISIGIAFIGNFTLVVPPKTQLNAAKELIELGIKDKKIASDYILLGNRQVVKTKSPGDALYNEIKKWPHWSPQP